VQTSPDQERPAAQAVDRHHEVCAVLPAFNEAECLPRVVRELNDALGERYSCWEILVVDDGSTDGTADVLDALRRDIPELRTIHHRRNLGKSAALSSAFASIDADVVVLMDADGQDDPAELDRLLDKLDDGYDLVTGRRSVRNDRFIKRSTSKLYNWTTAKVSGVDGRDFNSGFKAMRGDVARDLDLYGEMHRYIPPLAEFAGYASTEVDVNHRERLDGKSKFGRSRFWRGFFDLITVKFLTTYDARPFHLIGGAGLISGLIGMALLVWMATIRFTGGTIGTRPALLIGVLLVVVSVQLILVGLLAELVIHEGRQRVRREHPHEERR
jgi:glycosyltransferase involved in cell wall biosynthesis